MLNKDEIIKKWEASGFLKGLSGNFKENIAKLYESQAIFLINEVNSGKTDEFQSIFPLSIRLANALIPVQSIDLPIDLYKVMNENSTIKQKGKIMFDPPDVTNKHKKQSEWKKTAMVSIEGDIALYYSWFLEKRYNLTLNRPLRGAHVTIISDRESDMNYKWEEVKAKWDGKEIEVTLSVDPRTDGKHWWLNVPEEERIEIHSIRQELGLERPYFGLHLSLGHANDKVIEHSEYIHRLIKNGFID